MRSEYTPVAMISASQAALTTPFRELEDASHWMGPLASAMARRLGLNVTILLSGPIGEIGGTVDVRGYVCIFVLAVPLC